jgi:hypothetical protein
VGRQREAGEQIEPEKDSQVHPYSST